MIIHLDGHSLDCVQRLVTVTWFQNEKYLSKAVSNVSSYSSSQHASTPMGTFVSHGIMHIVTCHLAEVTFLPLPQSIKAGTRSIDPGGMQG